MSSPPRPRIRSLATFTDTTAQFAENVSFFAGRHAAVDARSRPACTMSIHGDLLVDASKLASVSGEDVTAGTAEVAAHSRRR